MLRTFHLRTRIFVALLAPVFLSLAAAAVVDRSLQANAQTLRQLVRTARVRAEARTLLQILADAEAGKRGFVLTGDERLLVSYHRGVASFEHSTRTMAQLVGDDRAQFGRVRQIQALFRRWQHEWAEPIIAERRLAGHDATAIARLGERIGTGLGRTLAAEMHRLADEFLAVERAISAQGTVAAERSAREARMLSVASPLAAALIALALGSILALYLSRALGSVVTAAEGLAAGDLTRRAQVTNNDELGVLARAFNTMADRLASRTEEAAALSALGDMLQSCLTLEEAHRVVASAAARLLPGARGALYAVDRAGQQAQRVAGWNGYDDADGPSGFELESCWAIRRGRAHAAPDLARDVACAHCGHLARGASLCVPLVAQGEALGVVHLVADVPGALDARLAATVAEQVALALANCRLRATLREQSVRDPLTGLHNRRYLHEALAREIRRAERSGRAFGLIYLDVDHFKRLNDTFGHAAGDLVLREVAALLVATFRGRDVVCRHGGEEFVVLLPETSEADTHRLAERLRAEVAALHFALDDRGLDGITVSLGVAAFPQHGATAEDLLQAGDAALYRAKREGRNCTRIASTRMAAVASGGARST